MMSVADGVREKGRQELCLLTAHERIEVALKLGEEDLDLFCAAQGLESGEGRLRLRKQRQHGRRPSLSATGF